MLDYKKLINEVQDFPEKGVLFRDISPILKNNFSSVIEDFSSILNCEETDYFIGIDSRGFLLASALAFKFKKGVVLIRKKGKLPPPLVSKSYNLEYASSCLEMSQGCGKVIIVDDVVATGGTLLASMKLCQEAGYSVIDVGVLVNLKALNTLIGVKSLIEYNE